MEQDHNAIALFDQDRLRFLDCARDFLENPNISAQRKRDAIEYTRAMLGQLFALVGSNRAARS